MRREYISSSPSQTKKIAKTLAEELSSSMRSLAPRRPKNQALIIALEGELGSGKTTFLQGFAKGLGIKEKILSPTFVIYKKFQIPSTKFQTNSKATLRGVRFASSKIQNSKFLYHIDCYRVEKPKELLALGFKELSSNPKNIIVIEWAEKIKNILPKNTIWINIEFINEKTRKITILIN